MTILLQLSLSFSELSTSGLPYVCAVFEPCVIAMREHSFMFAN